MKISRHRFCPIPQSHEHQTLIRQMNRILTVDEVLSIGLLYAGFHAGRQQRVARATNVGRFMSHYGSSPLVCAVIWEDLVTARDIWENQTHQKGASFEKFLMAMYFLKVYPTEEKLAGFWKICEKSASKWVWLFVLKIQALKEKKVSCMCLCLLVVQYIDASTYFLLLLSVLNYWQIIWPEAWSACEENFLFTVDGVHCLTNEVIHPTLAKDPQLYSHKFNQAGFGYELAIAINYDALVWINGPFVGSKHDITIFREDGLKETMPLDKKGIADKGYRGEKVKLCTPNSHDPLALRRFKVGQRGAFILIKVSVASVLTSFIQTEQGTCTT